MKTTILLCEGVHDTAFLSKILKSNGCIVSRWKIVEYPHYLRNFISERVKLNSVDDLNLSELRTGGRVIPSHALLKNEEMLFLLFSLNGDSTKEIRREIIHDFDTVYNEQISKEIVKGEELSIVFVYDADNDGVEKREKEVTDDLGLILSIDDFKIKNESYISTRNVRYGLYVFHEEDKNTGRLENMILPLVCKGHEDLYSCVSDIIKNVKSYAGYTKPVKHPDKAAIGMMGQLDKEGSAIPAIIDQSFLLTKDKILENSQCQRLSKFLLNY